MSDRRRLIEKLVVGLISVTIAVIFVVVTKPWEARLPRDHKPVHSTTKTNSTTSTTSTHPAP